MRLAAAVILLLAAATVRAQSVSPDDVASAKRHFAAGVTHFNLREYKAAIEEFQSGYRLKPDPIFFYNLGQAYRLDDQPEQALYFYKAYLRNVESAPNRRYVEERIQELEPIVEARKRAAPPRSIVPSSPSAPTAAPNAMVSAEPADARAGRGERLAGVITAAVGVAALGAAVGLSIVSKQASDKLTHGTPGSLYDFNLDRQGRAEQTASIALFAVGGAAVVAGVVVWALGWRAEHGARRFVFAPAQQPAMQRQEARADAILRF